MRALTAEMIHLHRCRNLVSFRPITWEFTRLNGVQQTLVSLRISFTALLGGDTAVPGGLHAFALSRISSFGEDNNPPSVLF